MIAGSLQDLTLNTTRIKGMRSLTLDPRLQHDPEGSSGLLHFNRHHYLRSAPMLQGVTRDLAAMWSLFSANGDAPSRALTAMTAYTAAGSTDAPGYASGSTAVRVQSSKGHAFLDGLNVSSGGKVEASFSAYLLSSDGRAMPYTETDQARPADDGAIDPFVLTALTLGAVDILPGFVGLNLAIGHGSENNVEASCFHGGLPHPVAMALAGAHGPIDIQATIEHQDVNLRPISGDLVATFAPLVDGGFVGSDSLQLALNGTVDPHLGNNASHGSPAGKSILCRGRQDGATLPLSLSTL